MPHVSGKDGLVLIGTASSTGIKAWSLDFTRVMLESTDFADVGVKAYVLAGSGWAGSFDGYKDGVPLTMGTTVVTLTLNESATGTWTGQAWITGVHPNVSFDGIVTYSYDFQGTGALAVPVA